MPLAKAKKRKRNSQVEERYKYAQSILEINSDEVRDTVNRMVEVMQRLAPTVDEKVHVWVAIRLLAAAAQWDIRISGFKAPKSSCAKCGVKVK
jgi:hypothetical protein